MAKQISHIKATGTVCGDINFYKDVDWGFLVRMLPGVDSKRFCKDPAFEGSRRSAERFALGNIMSSIIYRFIPVKRRYPRLFTQLRRIAIAFLKQGSEKGEVFSALFTFLTEQKRISLSQEQFNLLLSSFEEELKGRLKERKPEKERKMKNRMQIKVEAPLSEEDIEYFKLYMDDIEWTIRFEGEFPEDYRIPLFLLKHAV
jgi:hypothetical protein